MIKKILIANRGEIACRIIKTCRAMGIATVAVYSEADASALHVSQADEAVEIGPAPAAKSYLLEEVILAAAQSTGAQAIHPGYGFLSENAAFAEAVESAGLIWIGPKGKTIRDMGDKQRARSLAKAAGVPVLPGSKGFKPGDMELLIKTGNEVGFPLLVKAKGGGGGIGMRQVLASSELTKAVETAQGQAGRSFGDDVVYLERFVPNARHVEIQVFGFGDGEAIAFPERDCSIQRRFQKVLEESPAPNLKESVCKAMAEAALLLACQENFRSAGTVEFILDTDTSEFFFLEMNTRIQVEHPVTELVTGVDLVSLQIQLASGEALNDFRSRSYPAQGNAIEARIYAEDPEKNFLPRPGTLTQLVLPEEKNGIRVDSGVREGDKITPFYDPMIAKICAYGVDREAATEKIIAALKSIKIEGVPTNTEFLIAVFSHEANRRGAVSTNFISDYSDELLA